MKKIRIAVLIALGMTLIIYLIKGNMAKSPTVLHIELLGDKIIQLTGEEKYQEPGYIAVNEKGENITNQVEIAFPNIKKNGTYEIKYSITNKKGETVTETRYINVLKEYKDEYEEIDNTPLPWWSENKKDGTRPKGGYPIEALQKYNATFLGTDTKTIYLTFDEGTNDTYLPQIVDILNDNDVKATFFLCKNYIKTNPELIKKMTETGHSVGNHTAHHYKMNELATKDRFKEYLQEIAEVEEVYYEITGKQIDKVYREPRGEWSLRSLQIMKDLGYKTFFYSADYLDWNGDVTKEYALKELKKRVHNGAIYLIHPINKGNYLALDSFIKEMKQQGYQFDLVKNISF